MKYGEGPPECAEGLCSLTAMRSLNRMCKRCLCCGRSVSAPLAWKLKHKDIIKVAQRYRPPLFVHVYRRLLGQDVV